MSDDLEELVGSYLLRMANGAPLEEVLEDYANHLAWEIRERADQWINLDNPINNACKTGMSLAADQIDPLIDD